MAFVCARPDVASRAMDNGNPIPGEAGFMGLVTLEDVLESVLQETIIDEEDQTDRNLASATLTRWAAEKIQKNFRRRKLARQQRSPCESATRFSGNSSFVYETETASLLENGQFGRQYT